MVQTKIPEKVNPKKLILYITHGQLTENSNFILKELKNYWDVVCLVDEDQKRKVKWIEYMKTPNRWYDFWKMYYFFKRYKKSYDELVYTNDTISITSSFKPMFDWWDSRKDLDMWWATDSYSDNLWTKYWYHIQSFFHFFRRWAVDSLKARYFMIGIIPAKFDWVRFYETGFTCYMMDLGYKCWAWMEVDWLARKYWWERLDTQVYIKQWKKVYKQDWALNSTFDYPREYYQEGLPFIKNSCFQYHLYNPNLLPNLACKLYKDATNKRRPRK